MTFWPYFKPSKGHIMQNTANIKTDIPQAYTITLPKLLNQADLAGYLGKSEAWCERARWAGEGPKFVKLGRHVRYRADDVLAWIEGNARTSTTGEGAHA